MIISTGLGNEQLEVFYSDGFIDPNCTSYGDNCQCFNKPGYYYAFGQPGCLFDSDPIGPFDTEEEAYNDAIDTFELELGEYNDHY